MNTQFMFCVSVCCISSSVGIKLSYAELFSTGSLREVPELACRRHNFIYRTGDTLNAHIGIIPSTKLARADAIVRRTGLTGIETSREDISIGWPPYSLTLGQLYDDKLTIDVQLTTERACDSVRVLEGTRLGATNVTPSKHDDLCLNGRGCLLNMDVLGECTDKKLRPQPCEVYPDVSETTRTRIASRAPAPAHDTPSSPGASADDTNSDVSGADNTYFSIAVAAAVAAAVAMALGLLLVAMRQRCCNRSNPPGTLQTLLIPLNRYYENVVFRATSIASQMEVEWPEVERPQVERPQVERPQVERPQVERPQVELPEVERPERRLYAVPYEDHTYEEIH